LINYRKCRMTISQRIIDTKIFSLSPELKLKKMGLFCLYRETHIEHKQAKELQTIHAALENNFAAFYNISDFSLALKNLDERETFLNKEKELFYKIQDTSRRIYEEMTRERQQEDIMIESRINDALDDVTVMRILLKIVQEKKEPIRFLNKLGDLFDWLELRRPAVIFLESEQIIEQQAWQVITVENSQCRYWDDMPEHIRRRHSKFKKMFESAGCKVCYSTSPSSGTRITIMVPPEIAEGKFILTGKLFEGFESFY